MRLFNSNNFFDFHDCAISTPVHHIIKYSSIIEIWFGNILIKLLKTFTRNLADFYSSQIINSRVLRARSINSEFEKSVFEKSRFISDKIIKLDNYDERNITWWEQGTQQTYKLYKFYVSEDKFKRLVETQNFYFDGIKINKPNLDILNFFDDKFSFDAYKSSYDTITGRIYEQ